MSSTRLLLMDDQDTGVIVKDIVPRSMSDDGDDDDCSCTCSCCPTLFGWCVKDALGLSCSIITWLFFVYGEFVIVFIVLIPKNYSFEFNLFNLLVFHILVFLAISSHVRTMFTDPGTVPLNNAIAEKLLKYENGTVIYRCTTCQSIKPARAHHCRVCKRCIKRMDHHCVFVNNCVGENNQKYFILFTFYTCILSIYGLILLIFHIYNCTSSNWTACPVWSPPATLIFVILSILEGLAFSLFTAIMTGQQIFSIYTDTTGIEHYKGKEKTVHGPNSFTSSLKIIFGSPISIKWLNPYSKPSHLTNQND